MWNLYSQAMRFAGGLTQQQWFIVLCGVVIVGFLCLRGFGSRANY